MNIYGEFGRQASASVVGQLCLMQSHCFWLGHPLYTACCRLQYANSGFGCVLDPPISGADCLQDASVADAIASMGRLRSSHLGVIATHRVAILEDTFYHCPNACTQKCLRSCYSAKSMQMHGSGLHMLFTVRVESFLTS